MTDAVQLSCEQCTQKKVKCNKGVPCSACSARGLTCRPVQRARLPRGRTGKTQAVGRKRSALQTKILRLEQLVRSLEGQIEDPDSTSHDANPSPISLAPTSISNHSSVRLENLTARDFWVALSNEVGGLRETLEAPDLDDEDDSQSTEHGQPFIRDRFLTTSHSLIFPQNQQDVHVLDSLPHVKALLVETYHSRVDWMFKIVHWPSMSAVLTGTDTCLDVPSKRAAHALEYALYFLGSCALLDHEFDVHGLGDRMTWIEHLQHATEAKLTQAGLLTTTDVTVLQAFVLYIAAIRCSVSAASAWTLVAMAVRLADACRVTSESSGTHSAFETEMRRRLWFSIGFLDLQTSFGRGTLPLISYKDLIHPPKTINDAELSLTGPVPESTCGFTDMSFSSLCHQGMACQRKLLDPGFGTWRERLALVNAFEYSIAQNPLYSESTEDPRQLYMAFAAQSMPTALHLLLRRPLHRNFQNSVPPNDHFDMLDTACQIVQMGLTKSKSNAFAMFSWFKWPKWFALAVLLVELCGLNHGHSHEREHEHEHERELNSRFDQALIIAQASYDDYAQSATDVRSAELWGPIRKLMRRVQLLKRSRNGQEKIEHEGSKQEQIHNLATNLHIVDGRIHHQATRPAQPAHVYSSLAMDENVNAVDQRQSPTCLHSHSSHLQSDSLAGNAALSGFPTSTDPTPQLIDPYNPLNGDYNTNNDTTCEPTSWLHWDVFLTDVNEASLFDESDWF